MNGVEIKVNFPKIKPSKTDVEHLKITFMKGEWYVLPLAVLAFVVWLWPLSCGAFAYNLYRRLEK